MRHSYRRAPLSGYVDDIVQAAVRVGHVAKSGVVVPDGRQAHQRPQSAELLARRPDPSAVRQDGVHVRLVEDGPVVHVVPDLVDDLVAEGDKVLRRTLIDPAAVLRHPLWSGVMEQSHHHLQTLLLDVVHDFPVPLDGFEVELSRRWHHALPVHTQAQHLCSGLYRKVHFNFRVCPKPQPFLRLAMIFPCSNLSTSRKLHP
mmetsp:Transcript_33483/g.64131  ORF Transcript_33483/g.64131 Transcript_33483/m.64131 type:complete len:201 (-) Transcript_33483:241-843(-)